MLKRQIARRDFLKLVTATAAMLAVPIVAESQQRLELTVEIDEAKLEQAFKVYVNGYRYNKLENNVTAHVAAVFDEAKMWQALHATDQWGRHWTTPDGKFWTCGEDSFTLEA